MEFVPIIIIMGVMYFALIMPQQRRTKAHRLMMSQLEEGDEVLTSSGIYGTIAEFDGETVFLAVNDQMELKISKSSIAERVVYSDAVSD